MVVGALGVAYGDIDTSPLYAFREAVAAAVRSRETPVRETVPGVISLILWALILVATVKDVVSVPDYAPTALLHNQVLHERNIVLKVEYADRPKVPPEDRVAITPVSDHFLIVRLRFGFMETPDVPAGLVLARKAGLPFDIMQTTFFLSRRTLKASERSPMPMWQDKLFLSLVRSSDDATGFFRIPTGRVMEVGTQVTV